MSQLLLSAIAFWISLAAVEDMPEVSEAGEGDGTSGGVAACCFSDLCLDDAAVVVVVLVVDLLVLVT